MSNASVLAVSDLSCVGKCSLTVALPVISALGIEVSVIPTALLSTQTGGFDGYYFKNLSKEARSIIKHLKCRGKKFDCVYTGYLLGRGQVDMAADIIDGFKADGGFVVVDPVMADNGKLYDKFDRSYPGHILKLCQTADYIFPNLTECLLLTNSQKFDDKCIETLKGICKNFAVTSISHDNETGIYAYESQTESARLFSGPVVSGIFHGAGDLFASAVTGCLLSKRNFFDAVEISKRFVYQSIIDTKESRRDPKYGLLFEKNLYSFIKNVKG